MKRIAFVSTMGGYSWGGSEELWSQAAAWLIRQGVTVAANVNWSPTGPASQLTALEREGCQIKHRHVRHRLHTLTGGIFRDRTYRWLNAVRPDLVVISQGGQSEGLDWMRHCDKIGVPYAVILQAVAESFWPGDDFALAVAQLAEKAAAVYFVSQSNLELYRSQFATLLPKARVVRNPFNVSYDADPEWPREEGGWKLACVARLHPSAKGQDILFNVLRQEKWRKRDLQVTLFGSGPNGDTLKRLKDLHNIDRVTFGGHISDIEAMWASHHALVLPSRYEGLPLAVVEAMLCGRPCIVTDVAGNAELIEDGVTGFLAAAPTERFLDEALERAWQRRAEWRQIGQAAARRVRSLVPSDPAAVFATELKSLL